MLPEECLRVVVRVPEGRAGLWLSGRAVSRSDSKAKVVGYIHFTPLSPWPSLLSLRISSLMSSVYVALRCGSTRPSTIGDAIV